MRQTSIQAALLFCVVYIISQGSEAAVTSSSSAKEKELDRAISILEQLSDTRKGLSVLKEAVGEIDRDLKREHQLDNISRKRNALQILLKLLQEMDSDLIAEQKRNCRVNLGGHCATESAANVADQWHYLNSPLSPGRKRRDTRLYKKLIQGKLFK